ncbi:MAG: periplasmic heavy metal sensor [Deltaproteobacteria bacterium]|nr:periplasmic heavy metal sensor [Deltaproteobacteria bacterium]
MKRISAIGISAALMITSVAWAGGPGGPGGPMVEKLHRLATQLNLDSTTRAKINALAAQTKTAAQALRPKFRKARQALREALNEANPTERKVLARADVLNRLRTELDRIQLKALVKMHQLLTPQQRDKLRELRKDRRAKRQQCRQEQQARCGKGAREGKVQCVLTNYAKFSADCQHSIVKRYTRGLRRRGGFGSPQRIGK